MRRSYKAVFVALLIATGVFAQSGGNFSINQSTVANGGGPTGAGAFTVQGTTGQSAAGTQLTNSPYSEFGGFWTDFVTPTADGGNISGQVVDSSGNPLEGVAVRLSGTQSRLLMTDAHGNYNFTNVQANGFYIVTPTRPNFSFAPGQRSFTQLAAHTDAVFTATPLSNLVNPLDTNEYFVRQQYVDFLNREPDESGLAFWISNVASCGTDQNCGLVKRVDTSAAFFLSIEFEQTGYLVERFYKIGYGDGTGTSTIGGAHQLSIPIVRYQEFRQDTALVGKNVVVLATGWQQQLQSNQQAFASEFVQRARFVNAFPTSMAPADFVDRLNANAGSVLSANERAAAIDLFAGAANTSNISARAGAVRQIADNSQLFKAELDRAFVLSEYFGYLRRNPDDGPEPARDYSGYDFWLKKLTQFNGNYVAAEMVKAFVSSAEYRQRFAR